MRQQKEHTTNFQEFPISMQNSSTSTQAYSATNKHIHLKGEEKKSKINIYRKNLQRHITSIPPTLFSLLLFIILTFSPGGSGLICLSLLASGLPFSSPPSLLGPSLDLLAHFFGLLAHK